MTKELLRVEGLKTYFYTEEGIVRAVDGVDFVVREGEVLGLVGESGCGKSVTSLSIMRLISPPGRIVEGRVIFDGVDLLQLPESEMLHYRGNRISMIFQQPTSCLNPVYKVGDQIAEVLTVHRGMSREEAWKRARELLEEVGVPDAERRMHAYPHELSGGMAQRVMIAMALANEPELLIADEPTTALDVTVQAQILELMKDLLRRHRTSIILITHDLGVVAEMADRVAVMYAGKIVEYADVYSIFEEPLHPYTQALLASIPMLGVSKERLDVIPGSVPNMLNLPSGCRFHPRCAKRFEPCSRIEPDLLPIDSEKRLVRCWLYHEPTARGAVVAEAAGKEKQ
jgi:oligopeptide/dipeptide ABC transporter ATP-binding protein